MNATLTINMKHPNKTLFFILSLLSRTSGMILSLVIIKLHITSHLLGKHIFSYLLLSFSLCDY